MRAAAILLVLAAHWNHNICAWYGISYPRHVNFMGSLGVQVFFALSGFLIGQILIVQAEANPTWSNLATFLVRRWLRTLPLYYLVLVVMILVFPPAEHAPHEYLKFVTLTQNFYWPMPKDYWFAVSWSLTVEEWFYLLFGLAVFASYRLFKSPWAIWPAVLLFLVGGYVVRLHTGVQGKPGTQLQVLPLLDQIAYGVVMAQLYRRRAWPFRHPWLCLAAGAALIGVSWAMRNQLVWNMTVIGCALLLPAATRLKQAPPRWAAVVGTISAQSYGLYLVHMILLVDIAQRLAFTRAAPRWACVVIATTLPFVLSYLSFRYLEAPILRLRPRHRPLRARPPEHLAPAGLSDPAASPQPAP